ncbi:hypothetical protein EJ06DRAFT_486788 [Trichodelitschia bisporula]|uniref:Chitin biosynthesis protein n=1 Tax=Trichodelitschia bisporula TaxID=703511 RepID=A0A6G1I7F1_9PEZI|nr:hypothetical protein EJ06DRAFT_486788 [Trichodelitschia bisporula]
MLVSLTVGKVDAGMAVLLTEDKRIIEFPSVLLPPDITSGCIVDITVARNLTSENTAHKAFSNLQETIYQTFGVRSPVAPVLRCRNATQTSFVLEWDPIQLATAELRSLSLYRNGSKAGSIPRPTEMQSTKISGLAIDTEYNFHLVLRTSAGTYTSDKLNIRTHKMTDLSGITVTPGVMPASLKESLANAVSRIGARMIETVRIDTTHFVCTEGRGQAWERAVEMNIPVVVPDWVLGCEREGRIVGVRGYYLNADPKMRPIGPSIPQGQAAPKSPPRQQGTPRTEITPPTPERENISRRSRADSEDDPRPTPPPKSPRQQQQEAPRAGHQPLPSSPQGKEPSESDSESTEKGSRGTTPEPAGARKPTVEDDKDDRDDSSSFQDVAL